jgi:hypothetical protein
MGRVVEAYDTHLQRTVALKEVLPHGGTIERRFQREVRITARLEHAGIVPLYDSGRLSDGRPYYVMRRVSGKPLDDVIARARTLENRLALLPNVLAAIDAVAHAHRRGVIHRDLKPQNILVGELGETVVIDWGLAKVIGDNDEPVHDSLEPELPSAADSLQTQAGSVFGTPGFMPPEQARGDDLGPPGDVYALGATLYQMVAGKPPFRGSSATDVITSTLRNRLEPITKACPGAPPELVTIIEKALAYEQRDRYPDAGALAEDVRAFLTGQLVAAHRYTRRQRLARFARRNRAALVVAALALAATAVLAWIGVHRILRERDLAQRASLEASEQRQKADARAAEARERADQLLLLHARSLLDTNPTQSIAVLKQLDATGALRGEAEAIARAAVLRGVAFGMPALGDITVSFEMTADGKRVLQVARDGNLQIIDVATRKRTLQSRLARGSTAYWVAGGRAIFVDVANGSPALLDPATGAITPLAIAGEARAFGIAPAQDKVAVIDGQRRLAIVDVATQQVTFVPGVRPDRNVELGANGTWVAYDEQLDARRRRFVIADVATGRVLAQRAGSVNVLAASPGNGIAVAFEDGVFEIRDLASPVLTRVPVDQRVEMYVHAMMWNGDVLVLLTARSLLAWNGRRVGRLRDFNDTVMLVKRTAGDALVAATNDGVVFLIHDDLVLSMRVTSRPVGLVRIAASPATTHVLATAGDAVLDWDTTTLMPSAAPVLDNATFANENLLVAPGGFGDAWTWYDTTRSTTLSKPFAANPGMPRLVRTDPSEGRTLVVAEHGDAAHNTAVVGYPDGRQLIVDGVAYGLADLVEGDGLVYSPGSGRLFGRIGNGEAHEIVTLDGELDAVAGRGRLGYVAISRRGDVVRGLLDGSAFERVQLAAPQPNSIVVGQADGSVLIASGAHLYRWTSSVDEVATLSGPVVWLRPTPTGTIVALAEGQMWFVPASGSPTPRQLPVHDGQSVIATDSRVVALSAGGQLAVVEIPSLAEWTLPRLYSPGPRFAVSPTGDRYYQVIGGSAILWDFPRPGSDFGAWLDSLTNATEDSRHLRWPW